MESADNEPVAKAIPTKSEISAMGSTSLAGRVSNPTTFSLSDRRIGIHRAQSGSSQPR